MNRSSRFRFIFIPYSIMLTYLLLAPDPLFFLPAGNESVKPAAHKTLPDYVNHAIAWSLFTALFATSTTKSTNKIFILAITYSTFLELAQPLFNRVTEFSDLAANSIGIILAVTFRRLVPFPKLRRPSALDPE